MQSVSHSPQLPFISIVENFTNGIIAENTQREITLINQAFCDLFAIKADPRLLAGLDYVRSSKQLKRLLVDPEGFNQREKLLILQKCKVIGDEIELADGRWLERDYIPVFNQNQYEGHFWKYRDITEKKKILLEKEELIRELQSLNDLKSNLLSVVAHDISSPLATLQSLLQVQADLPVADTYLFFEQIKCKVESVSETLQGLLQWAMMQQNGFQMEYQWVTLHQLIETAAQSVCFEQKENRLINSVKPDLRIYTNESIIKLILRNLLTNANKFTADGKIRVKAWWQNGQLLISVTDNGRGMSFLQQENLFKPQRLLSTTGTAGEKGTGLGLFLCSEFISQYGGNIWVRSVAGKGSCFTFSLPCESD